MFSLCVLDNWALIHAQKLALKENLPLHVCFCLFVPKSELSTLRHYSFMLKGLEEVEKVSGHIVTSTLNQPAVQRLHPSSTPFKQQCKTLDIQFHLLLGAAGKVLPGFVSDHKLGAVVTDFSPLREPLQNLEDVKKQLSTDVPLVQVRGICC